MTSCEEDQLTPNANVTRHPTFTLLWEPTFSPYPITLSTDVDEKAHLLRNLRPERHLAKGSFLQSYSIFCVYDNAAGVT